MTNDSQIFPCFSPYSTNAPAFLITYDHEAKYTFQPLEEVRKGSLTHMKASGCLQTE